jgi:hypothetical protein
MIRMENISASDRPLPLLATASASASAQHNIMIHTMPVNTARAMPGESNSTRTLLARRAMQTWTDMHRIPSRNSWRCLWRRRAPDSGGAGYDCYPGHGPISDRTGSDLVLLLRLVTRTGPGERNRPGNLKGRLRLGVSHGLSGYAHGRMEGPHRRKLVIRSPSQGPGLARPGLGWRGRNRSR